MRSLRCTMISLRRRLRVRPSERTCNQVGSSIVGLVTSQNSTALALPNFDDLPFTLGTALTPLRLDEPIKRQVEMT
jgi:hypothetical protein